MPWSPSYDAAVPDARLDPFRGRAGLLTLAGEQVGHVLVETDFGALQTGGLLWWRRWAPAEYAYVATRLGDETTDDMVLPDDLDGPIAQWSAGELHHAGTTYGVTWLDEAESDRVHHEVFGHHH